MSRKKTVLGSDPLVVGSTKIPLTLRDRITTIANRQGFSTFSLFLRDLLGHEEKKYNEIGDKK